MEHRVSKVISGCGAGGFTNSDGCSVCFSYGPQMQTKQPEICYVRHRTNVSSVQIMPDTHEVASSLCLVDPWRLFNSTVVSVAPKALLAALLSQIQIQLSGNGEP